MPNTKSGMTKRRREDSDVDRMSEESFPASDPRSTSPPAGSRRAERHEGRAAAGAAGPKGHPGDDRYHQETAAARQHGAHPPERDNRHGGER